VSILVLLLEMRVGYSPNFPDALADPLDNSASESLLFSPI